VKSPGKVHAAGVVGRHKAEKAASDDQDQDSARSKFTRNAASGFSSFHCPHGLRIHDPHTAIDRKLITTIRKRSASSP
jgi:hypothetical protein